MNVSASPWKISYMLDASGQKCPNYIIDANGLSVCEGLFWLKESEANARLIAAAPDLLEALIEAQACLVDSEYSEDGYARRLILAAIEKATGEE